MSGKKTGAAPPVEAKDDFLAKLKDRSLLAGWIAGLLLIGTLVWVLSRPLLSHYLLRSVNQSMIVAGETMRLSGVQALPQPKHAPLGAWYSILSSSDQFFVFTIFQDGILSVCGARLTPENAVTEIMPLSAHARQIFDRLSPGTIKMYSRRIENAAAQRGKHE